MEDQTELFDEDAVVRLLRKEIKHAGSQLALARQLATRRPYLNRVVNKRRSPTRSMIAKLGLEVVYKGDVVIDHKELLRRLRSEIKRAGGQAAWSRQTGIDRTVISKVVNNERRPNSRILSALRFERVYRRKNPRPRGASVMGKPQALKFITFLTEIM
jgi:DNA-binding phage protein